MPLRHVIDIVGSKSHFDFGPLLDLAPSSTISALISLARSRIRRRSPQPTGTSIAGNASILVVHVLVHRLPYGHPRPDHGYAGK
ncbi:hypothetical protein ACLK1T_28160 [Escherichia coli]